ncbi:hypothetical protein GX888_00935 [Candidatus Dojkabacteria bacterium]|uniref:Uncharacterized protein n=1 Tax=Candidatus Dojkabacteria bacterium TaxID=2099670 RepID=A0A847VCT7_9BACT|nr:hypothetical protein [Candidatus Dojkabacteria bacterium]
MTLIERVLQNWSRYEMYTEISLLVAVIILSLITIYIFTKNRRILFLSSISFVIATLLNLLGIFLIDIFFDIPVSQTFRLIPVITHILLLTNLGLLVGIYNSKREYKRFKIGDIVKDYLDDSIKQSIFLALLGIATLLFVSLQTGAIISISIISTLISIWLTYWISKYILK